MKTAISIPDALFEEAERVARSLKISRSRLYAAALESYVRKHDPSEVTRSLNRVYGKKRNRPDPALSALALEMLGRSEW
jgi:metal-responsive CopG/Arc/MetJ family transcriptional regulator